MTGTCMMGPKNGTIVWYRWPLEDGKKTGPSFSALIYKVHSSPDDEFGFVGLYVFTDDGIKQFRKVAFDSKKEECWRWDE